MRSLRILSLAVLALSDDRLPYEGSVSPPALLGKLDVSCILRTWKIKGVLACPWRGSLRPCLWVENAYPCGILEVVRQPFRTHLAALPAMPARKLTSGHNEGNLQFAETRVYTFVPPLAQDLEIPIAAPRGPFFRVNYVSELDALGWRTGLLDLLRAPEADCACAWGRYVPRTGFVAHQSEVMAAHLQALRGGRVASSPFGRIVLSPYPFEPRTGHYIQRVSPAGPGCVRIGEPDVRGLEAGALSPHGAYLFVHFGLFEECRRCLEPRLVGPRSP